MMTDRTNARRRIICYGKQVVVPADLVVLTSTCLHSRPWSLGVGCGDVMLARAHQLLFMLLAPAAGSAANAPDPTPADAGNCGIAGEPSEALASRSPAPVLPPLASLEGPLSVHAFEDRSTAAGLSHSASCTNSAEVPAECCLLVYACCAASADSIPPVPHHLTLTCGGSPILGVLFASYGIPSGQCDNGLFGKAAFGSGKASHGRQCRHH